jgi:hypothetical protein
MPSLYADILPSGLREAFLPTVNKVRIRAHFHVRYPPDHTRPTESGEISGGLVCHRCVSELRVGTSEGAPLGRAVHLLGSPEVDWASQSEPKLGKNSLLMAGCPLPPFLTCSSLETAASRVDRSKECAIYQRTLQQTIEPIQFRQQLESSLAGQAN